jgi:ParB family chromosome partitioning protein
LSGFRPAQSHAAGSRAWSSTRSRTCRPARPSGIASAAWFGPISWSATPPSAGLPLHRDQPRLRAPASRRRRTVIADDRGLGASVERRSHTDLLHINEEFTASLAIVRCAPDAGRALRWKVRLDRACARHHHRRAHGPRTTPPSATTICCRGSILAPRPTSSWPRTTASSWTPTASTISTPSSISRGARRCVRGMTEHRRPKSAHPDRRHHRPQSRVRNRRIFQELVTSIANLGLKKPITVSQRPRKATLRPDLRPRSAGGLHGSGPDRDPAIVIEASEEDCFVMSLVENLARRQHTRWNSSEIGALRERGYSYRGDRRARPTSARIRLGDLLPARERRGALINAVERGVIPHTIAMEIAKAKEGEVQQCPGRRPMRRRRSPATRCWRSARSSSSARPVAKELHHPQWPSPLKGSGDLRGADPGLSARNRSAAAVSSNAPRSPSSRLMFVDQCAQAPPG